MSRNLETRYHRLLRWYPKDYRRRRAAEMVSTYLDAAPEGARRPPLRDVLDVVVHGSVRRLSLSPGQFWAEILVDAGPAALGMAAGFSAVALGRGEVLRSPSTLRFDGTVGPFYTLGPVVYVLAFLAATALLTGAGRVARLLAVAAELAALAVIPVADAVVVNRPPVHVIALLVLLLGLAGAAPAAAGTRSRLLVCGGLCAGAGWTLAATVHAPAELRGSFYRSPTVGLPSCSWLPWWLLGVVVAGIAVAVFTRKPQLVIAAILVTIPWTVISMQTWTFEQLHVALVPVALLTVAALVPAVPAAMIFARQRQKQSITSSS